MTKIRQHLSVWDCFGSFLLEELDNCFSNIFKEVKERQTTYLNNITFWLLTFLFTKMIKEGFQNAWLYKQRRHRGMAKARRKG